MRKFTLLMLMTSFAPVHAAEATPEATHLFISGQEGYKRYRIPSLLTTPKGTVLAICEGRKDGRGLTGNIDLVLKRSTDSGKTWGPLEVIVDDGDFTLGNPCPVIDPKTGTLWLLFTRSVGVDLEEEIVAGTKAPTRVFVTFSTDDGKAWAKPRDITASVRRDDWTWYGTGPGVGIALKSGRLFIPSYHAEKGSKRYFSHSLFSDDGGKTWAIGASLDADTSEPQAAERADGTLVLSARTMPPAGKKAGDPFHRTVALSEDGGTTWQPATIAPMLHDPSCQASLYRWPGEEKLWLYSHPMGPGRRDLTLQISKDEGRTWAKSRLLRSGDAQYSCLTKLPDSQVGCLYESWTNGNYQMDFTRFPK